ncbi:MAG: response regulator transcription factor [Eubacteriales bacterium]|nr:response regulator transcription factor [Eubacteriales bacterium]
MKQILVIEDDDDIRELLDNFLTSAGYQITLAADGIEGLLQFEKKAYDLILLDLLLPKIDGFGVCEIIRKKSKVPIVMVTALGGEEDQIRGLDLMADDYITKPFSMQVLLRKIAAVFRRREWESGQREGHSGEENTLIWGDLCMDTSAYKVWENGEELILTQKEYELLRTLLEHPGKVLTRQYLLDQVWGYDFFGDERIVDTHIKNLRKKTKEDYIHTVRGVGYCIDQEYSKKPDH